MASINAVHTISLDNANFQNNVANNGGGSFDLTCVLEDRKGDIQHLSIKHGSLYKPDL
jgi:hypothetical protein